MHKNLTYDDIIQLPHPTSKHHPRMELSDRAAQFSPFSALTGYEAAIKETARLTNRRIELDEYEKADLDLKLQLIREHIYETNKITVTYFVPDERKGGGAYLTETGHIKKIDDHMHQFIMTGGKKIPFNDIIELDAI